MRSIRITGGLYLVHIKGETLFIGSNLWNGRKHYLDKMTLPELVRAYFYYPAIQTYIFLAVINVGLDLLLIPKYGVIGAVIPVALVIVLSPFIYKRVLGRFVSGVEIPYVFIMRCFLASSPLLLILPFAHLIRGIPELVAVSIIAFFVVLVSYKQFRVVGEEERDLLASIPLPAAGRLVKFIST